MGGNVKELSSAFVVADGVEATAVVAVESGVCEGPGCDGRVAIVVKGE